MTLNAFLTGITENSPLLVAIAIIVWLSLPQLAERFAIIGKLLKPLSKRWREKAARLESERRQVALEEAKKLAAAAMAEMTPPDVSRMEARLKKLDEQLDIVQDGENLLRAYVIYDELWHFHDDRNAARRGRPPTDRLTFDSFETKWRGGWRPFDHDGRLVDDGSGEDGERLSDG